MFAQLPAAPVHRIAIQMAAEGRFLICLDCEVRFEFPTGKSYLAVAELFASQACKAPRGLQASMIPTGERTVR